MKTSKIIFFAVLTAFMFAACTADFDQVIVKQDGTWKVDKITSESYTNGNLDSTEVVENQGTITFNSDNTGSYQDLNGESGNFTWWYDAAPERLIWTEDSVSLGWDVLEFNNRKQSFRNYLSFEILGQSFLTITTIDLSR